MSRMDWCRTKRHGLAGNAVHQMDRLEKEADRILIAGGPKSRSKTRQSTSPTSHAAKTISRPYYRSVGSVVLKDDRWFAVDAHGSEVSEHASRREAWRIADSFGMEFVG